MRAQLRGHPARRLARLPAGGRRSLSQAGAADETSALLGEHGGGVLALYEPSLSVGNRIREKPLDLPAEAARLASSPTLARCLLAYRVCCCSCCSTISSGRTT
ncbi:MAG: hypothetical protein U0166_16090 [Acidobacteriota bacterium]